MVVGNDARELFEQIEDDVRAPLVDCLAQLGQLIADAEDANVVPEAPQRVQNVVLGAESSICASLMPPKSSGGTSVLSTMIRIRYPS